MKKWNIHVTFFKKLYDLHYTCDSSFKMDNFTFVKVNDDYQTDLSENKLAYNLFYEHDYKIYEPIWQKKGYHENSVLYHVFKNKEYKKYDFVGFIEYDHVLNEGFCDAVQGIINGRDDNVIFSFESFTYSQLWDQGIILNPNRPGKQEGKANSRWNCINVILKDYNDFFGTDFTLHDLQKKNCFPLCHAFLINSSLFEKIMTFHSHVMETGRIEKYHTFNWRSNAGIMERYLAVALCLQEAEIITDFQLEHRSYDIKVIKPEWSERTLFKKLRFKILGY